MPAFNAHEFDVQFVWAGPSPEEQAVRKEVDGLTPDALRQLWDCLAVCLNRYVSDADNAQKRKSRTRDARIVLERLAGPDATWSQIGERLDVNPKSARVYYCTTIHHIRPWMRELVARDCVLAAWCDAILKNG